MSRMTWDHRWTIAAAAGLLVAACGGEVRSESDVPDGGTAVVDGHESRPVLKERFGASIDDWIDEEVARQQGMVVGAEPENESVVAEALEETAAREAARVAAPPEPLPTYSKRPEVEGHAPVLRGSDPEGSIVEAVPDPELERADPDWETAPTDAFEPEPLTVPAGVELELAIESELSTERNRPGDMFYATLVDDLLAPDGLVLMAHGTRLRGVVTESLPSESADVLPVLELSIEAVVGNAGDQPVSAVVLESQLEVDERDSGGETAAKVATGAAAGAILGRILGDRRRDAVKGGIVGAAAGAAVALGTRGGHARLRPGARILIRLERPLIVTD